MKIPVFVLGATGKYPKGKIHDSDEGELKLVVGHAEGNVIIDFGTPTKWIGLPPDQALQLVRLIQQHAHEAQGGRTQ